MNPPRPRKTYGDESVDGHLNQLIELIGTDNNDDLVRALMVSALDMDAADVDRLELKIASQSIAEMLNAWRVFSPFDDRPKVTIFGSARTKPDHPDYQLATEFGRMMTERDWMSITGAGPGIMHAGIEGAGRENSFGVNIVLPFEQTANRAIADDPKLASFRYFFTRKLSFMKESDAFVLFPGGFGTLDETFELLTLVQTGKSYPVPIVMLDHPESSYWDGWRNFVAKELGERGMISDDDRDLYLHTHDAAVAVEYICSFYACYHSIRYVGGQLVVRLRHRLSEAALATLNDEFSDIVAKGQISVIETTKAEQRDNDNVDLHRIAFRFDNKSFARLVTLARRINELGGDVDGQADGQAARGLLHDVGPEPDSESL
jgi:uncharacterized protein (TIGR00730 family)